ncbi:hypothetical protein [Leptospira santarosai]|uniref:hypothetical protein n=1 Tax=Leptospira santarosai TaxID=28183 RepID=UPI0024AFD1CA|nr:hypothetical protein [Leptospira santarosai]MDI7190843.1 hypothetical protein [Leptospira santarosai]
MSLTGVSDSLRDFIRPVKYIKKLGKTKNSKGEFQTSYAAPIDLDLPTTTVSYKQRIVMPEGNYTSEDRNFYQIGNALAIDLGDQFEFDGATYIVKDKKNLMFEAGFIRYVCKKEIRNT